MKTVFNQLSVGDTFTYEVEYDGRLKNPLGIILFKDDEKYIVNREFTYAWDGWTNILERKDWDDELVTLVDKKEELIQNEINEFEKTLDATLDDMVGEFRFTNYNDEINNLKNLGVNYPISKVMEILQKKIEDVFEKPLKEDDALRNIVGDSLIIIDY